MSEKVCRYLKFRLLENAVLMRDPTSNFKGLVAESTDYLRLKIIAADCFKDYAMAVIYWVDDLEIPEPVINLIADVPNAATAKLRFSVQLVLQQGTQRIYTNKIEVYQNGRN